MKAAENVSHTNYYIIDNDFINNLSKKYVMKYMLTLASHVIGYREITQAYKWYF